MTDEYQRCLERLEAIIGPAPDTARPALRSLADALRRHEFTEVQRLAVAATTAAHAAGISGFDELRRAIRSISPPGRAQSDLKTANDEIRKASKALAALYADLRQYNDHQEFDGETERLRAQNREMDARMSALLKRVQDYGRDQPKRIEEGANLCMEANADEQWLRKQIDGSVAEMISQCRELEGALNRVESEEEKLFEQLTGKMSVVDQELSGFAKKFGQIDKGKELCDLQKEVLEAEQRLLALQTDYNAIQAEKETAEHEYLFPRRQNLQGRIEKQVHQDYPTLSSLQESLYFGRCPDGDLSVQHADGNVTCSFGSDGSFLYGRVADGNISVRCHGADATRSEMLDTSQ